MTFTEDVENIDMHKLWGTTGSVAKPCVFYRAIVIDRRARPTSLLHISTYPLVVVTELPSQGQPLSVLVINLVRLLWPDGL